MEIFAREHRHPISGNIIYGYLLEQFDRFSDGDVYASNDGVWKKCPLMEVRHTGKLVCVRPAVKNYKS